MTKLESFSDFLGTDDGVTTFDFFWKFHKLFKNLDWKKTDRGFEASINQYTCINIDVPFPCHIERTNGSRIMIIEFDGTFEELCFEMKMIL